MLTQRQTAESLVSGGSKKGRVNLLNWDGTGMPDGLFPDGTSAARDGKAE